MSIRCSDRDDGLLRRRDGRMIDLGRELRCRTDMWREAGDATVGKNSPWKLRRINFNLASSGPLTEAGSEEDKRQDGTEKG